jgi:hypothetical protein
MMTKFQPLYYQTYTSKPQFQIEKRQITSPKYIYHYSYYFDWLRQKETVVAECAVTNTYHLLLTSKALSIKTKHKTWGESTKILPLSKIDSIDANFQRLVFPLIIGGVVAPLALFAALLGVIYFWIGMAMTLSGLFLIYYGWAGAYQLKITAFQNQQLSYFVDFKTKKLENLIQETQRLIDLKEELNRSLVPVG